VKIIVAQPLARDPVKVGVGIGPPKVELAPKPTSSIITSKTLGAPSGAAISFGQSMGSDSPTDGAILPTF
jgi:hypothetical protein